MLNRRTNGVCYAIMEKYPKLIALYEKIERIDAETANISSFSDAQVLLEERWRLIDMLIKDTKENNRLTVFESVKVKSLDKEMGWNITWPIKFFVPRNKKGIITGIESLKPWIENSGGLFIPHNSCGGFYRNDKDAGKITIILFPESIDTAVKIESSGGSNDYSKINIISLRMQGYLLCCESNENSTEIALTFEDVIPKIEFG